MPSRTATYASIAAFFVVALTGFGYVLHRRNTPPVPVANVVNESSYDQFRNDLAQEVSNDFHVDPASVIVAPADWDVGTLLDNVRLWPTESAACRPAPMPAAISAGHLFPSYSIGSDIASTLTLGSANLQTALDTSVNLAHSANLVFSIAEPQIQFIDLSVLKHPTGTCGQYIGQNPGDRIIGGVLIGKMSFTLKASDPSAVQQKLAGVGSFNFTNTDSSSLTVADQQPTKILLMIFTPAPQAGAAPEAPATSGPPAPSPVTTAAPSSASLAASSTGTATFNPAEAARFSHAMVRRSALPAPVAMAAPLPAPVNAVAHIYFQQDKADAPDAGAILVRELQQAWPQARVEPKVELVQSAQMPALAQVRFFNVQDAGIAEQCRRILATGGFKARVVRIGIAAPPTQLEVWLPRAGPAPTAQ